MSCCDMIAMKREVATGREAMQVVPWSEGHVELTTSHCIQARSYLFKKQRVKVIFAKQNMTHTEKCTVTACRTYHYKVRKGGDFFYGKSSYEDYTQGLRSSVG